MPKTFKIIVIAVAAVFTLLVAGIAILAATFNPNDYKPLVIRLVQEKKQRTLTIPGEIKLTFFPRIGADLGRVMLSEHKGSAEFLSVDKAKVSLALLPLLKKQLVVDKVIVDGLHANIRRFKDGTTNFDDLLSKEESGEQLKFDIDSVDISKAHIVLDDQQARRKLDISEIELETGKIANGVPSKLNLSANVKGSEPAIDIKLAFKSSFTIDLGQKHFVLKDMDAGIQGNLFNFNGAVFKLSGNADLKPADKRFLLDGVRFSGNGKHGAQAIEFTFNAPKLAITDTQVSGGKLDGDAKLSEGARTVSAHFTVPSFEGTPQAFKIPAITLDAAVKDATLDAKANVSGAFNGDIDKLLFSSPQLKLALSGKQGDTVIDGTLTTPVSANLKTQLIELPAINAAFTLPNPGGGSMRLNASGHANANLDKQNLAAVLKGKLDESSFDAKLGLTKFSPAVYTFDIDIDRIDADRYKDKAVAVTGGTAEAKGGKAPAEKPIDLSALRGLQANGSLQVGALKFHNLRLANVRATLHAAEGKLDINPLMASLYGGSASGALSAGGGKAPHFSMRQNFSGINAGPLLKDATGKESIEGRGNVSLDVSAAGTTVTQIKKALNGNAKLDLRDGALHGINIAQTIRNARAKLGELRGDAPTQSGTGNAAEKTDFSEMSGSFRITNGVAHNEDLSLKSPLLRVGGKGDIDIGNDRLDYVVRATVVSNLQGQGGPELQTLKGLTIPVRLSGPFTAIAYNVDFQGLVKDLAQQKIDEKKDELKQKAREEIKDQLKGLFGK